MCVKKVLDLTREQLEAKLLKIGYKEIRKGYWKHEKYVSISIREEK